MYSIIKFFENGCKYLKIKIKIFYWKIKYGKKIKIGKNLRFRKSMIINISKTGYLEIGNNNAFNNFCSINCHKRIKIGNDNMFGENVKIYDHNHVFNNKKIDIRKEYYDNDVIIGNHNWLASDVTLLSKAKIGDYNVVGTKAIINHKIDDENIIKNTNTIVIEKIKYVGENNER